MYKMCRNVALLALLVTLPVWAGNGADDKDAAGKDAPAAPTAAKKTTAKYKEAEKPASANYSAEIEQLREMVLEQSKQLEAQQQLMRDQQEKLSALTEELRTAHTGSASMGEVAGSSAAGSTPAPQADAELTARVEKVEKEVATNKKNLEGQIKAIGPFSFSGDLRLRDEPFFGGPTPSEVLVQNRMRYRLRVNLNAKLNNEISGGLSVASGDLNDPISTNQTMGQFYTRKIFAVDRAFINYNPRFYKPLSLIGGKFAYPFYRTELVWDNDLNPEGLAQTLQWNIESVPVLKKVALVGFELPFTAIRNPSSSANRSSVQSVVYGGQLQTTFQLAKWLKLSAYAAYYNYHNADPIALALAQASVGNPFVTAQGLQTPAVGLLPLGGSVVQNSRTVLTASSAVTADVTTGGVTTPTLLPTGVVNVVSAQFASKFGLFDTIARFDIKTPYERWPLTVLGDYVQNTRACGNVGNIPTVARANTASIKYTLTNSQSLTSTTACDSNQRRAYWLEAMYGRAQERGDWQFTYTRMFVEREAVMSAFNYSDMYQNSNVTEQRVEVFYNAYKNVQLGFTGLFGRPLNLGKPNPPPAVLTRLQFDVNYKF